MNKFAGLVIDQYDDVDGALIRSLLTEESIPDFIKSAERVDPEGSAKIPDDNYALVLLDKGNKMRKYATIDKGNTALSVLYLLKQAHLLPEKAVKVAAQNLIEACERFKLDIPQQLKLASASGVSGMAAEQHPGLRQAVNKGREANDRKDSESNPQLGKGDPTQDVRKRANTESVAGGNFMEIPPFSTKERFSDSQGTSIDHEKLAADYERSTYGADAATFGLFNYAAETKKKNWRTSPYVDVQEWEPGFDLLQKQASVQRTLLDGRYPVDSFEQVKTAASYFKEHEVTFDPKDRRTYCVKLAARMNELGIKITPEIAKYAAAGYGDSVAAFVNFRKHYVTEDFHPVLDTLLEKQAYVKPETFADALEAFDRSQYLNYRWDGEIPDPYSSTFGTTMAKIAEDEWRWDQNGVRVCEGDLDNLATNGRHLVKRTFGDKFADEFCKSPKTFFESLPTPNKLVLGRLAMDRYSGTGTE